MSRPHKKPWTRFVTRGFPRWIRAIECYFRGHSHPMLRCVYCDRESPLEFNHETRKYEYKK